MGIIMSDTTLSVTRAPSTAEPTAFISEDWLAVILGLAIFILALAALVHVDLIGWVVSTSVWTSIGQALGPAAKGYSSLGGFGALLATYAALTIVLSAGAVALKTSVTRFALAFTAVFWIAYASWIVGNYANFAAVTPAEQQKFGIGWSLKLTSEGAYIFALLAGLIITNFLPRFYLALGTPAEIAKNVPAAIGEANTFRVIFFMLTFFSIGVLSNFKALWQEGFGKLAAVYLVSLFGFVIWVGLVISWLFFSGIKPPLAT
jgi:hypothetical protein